MKNPWTKRNPLLSMWMSAANAVTGAARVQATAQAKRLASTWMTQSANQMTRWWTDALKTSPPRKRRKRR